MSKFASKLTGQSQATTVAGQLMSAFKARNNEKPMANKAVAKMALATESYAQEGFSADLASAGMNIQTLLRTTNIGIKDAVALSYAQEDAGVIAGMIAGDPEAAEQAPQLSEAQLAGTASDDVVVVTGASPDNVDRVVSTESYDERQNKNVIPFTISYNTLASRQDEFGEAFYPTVTVTPDMVGFEVSIKLIEVIDPVKRQISGSLAKYNKRNIVKAVRDASILRNDTTRIIPVVRPESAANFATGVAAHQVTVQGETVDTAPYALNKKFDILGMSQTAASLAAGVMDETDAVDSAVKLSAVYVKLAGGDIISFATSNFPSAQFTAAVQGDDRTLNLNFTTVDLQVTAATKTIGGAALADATDLGTNSVRLSLSMFGNINQREGWTEVGAMGLGVSNAYDNTGTVIPFDAGAGLDAATVFAGATVIGYDLHAFRTNSNRRTLGQLLQTRTMTYRYAVPLLSPIGVKRPVSSTEANDESALNSLITTTHIRTSNEAVTKLLEQKDFLKAQVSQANSSTDVPKILGAACELITPAFDEQTINVAANLNSLTSSEKRTDVAMLLVNKIRDMAANLYNDSGYKAAAEALNGTTAQKPTVIIGTDQVTASYLCVNGDMRLMGDQFDTKVVSTLDTRMAGKVVFSFGSSFNTGVADPLHFGNMAWKPEVTLVMPMNRDGAQSMELAVQPSFIHVNNLPVMGVLNVEGITAAIGGRVAITNQPI